MLRLSATLSLRPVSPEDGPALAELRVDAMKPSLEAIGRFDAARARNRFLDGFDPGLTREILSNCMRVGFVVVRPVENYWLLDHLYVTAAAQGAGIGSTVLRQVISEARAADKVLRVGALKRSASNAFYRHHGFKLEREAEWDCYYILEPRGP